MSKKLIAVAAAAALALTGLVGVAPAMAVTMTVSNQATGTGTALDPYDVNVPDDNIIDTTGNQALVLAISSLAAGDVVTVATTGAVKVTQTSLTVASRDLDNTTVGKSALTSTRTDTSAISWLLYTTSDVTGTAVVTVTRTGLTTTNTYHIKGIAGAGYNVSALSGMPSTLGAGASTVVSFKVTDVFGNAVDSDYTDKIQVGAIGTAGSDIDSSYDASLAAHKFTLSGSADPSYVIVDLDVSDSIAGLPAKNDEVTAYFNTPAAAAANATATAQIAALTAQLAESRPKAKSVTKKRFNTLARKWNAAFPSQKVALKK
jgi:hypothetical protein